MAIPPYKSSDHQLTQDDIRTLFNDPTYVSADGIKSGSNWLVDDPFGTDRGTVLRCDFYKDQWGRGAADPEVIPPEYLIPMGLSTSVVWSNPESGDTNSSFSEIYYSMDIAFPLDFIFPAGIHGWNCMNTLKVSHEVFPRSRTKPGEDYRIFGCNLGQTNAVLDTRVPSESGGADHSLTSYHYNAEVAQYDRYWTTEPLNPPINANSADRTYIAHVRGQWARIETHLKLNTFIGDIDQHDGLVEAWFNGVKVLDMPDFPWKNSDYKDLKFNRCSFGNWIGGSGALFAMPQDQCIYYDNLTVSTSKVT